MALTEQLQQPQPAPARATTSRLRPYRPMLLALLAFIVVRGSVMFNGYLYADDFALRWWAHTSGLTPEYVFRSYYGHVQPFGTIVGWFCQALFPGSFTALMVCSLVAQVAVLAILWRIMLRLTGSNMAAFLAFMVPAFSMFTFETGVWWVEIAETVPYALFMMVAIWALIRALEGQPGHWWRWSALAYAGAAMSISKSAVGVLVLFMITAALPIGVPRRRGIRGALRANPRYFAAISAMAVAWTSFVLVFAPISKDPDAKIGRAIVYARDLLFDNIAVGAVGGPWRWFSAPGETWNGVLTIPQRTPLMLTIGVLVVIAWLVIVKLFRPNLMVYSLWMVFYACAITALAAYGRGGSLIASSGYRYSFDFWIPLSLFMGLLLYPVIGEENPFSARARALAARLQDKGLGRTALAILGAALFVASALISAIEPSLRWINSETKSYVQTAQATMADASEDAQFLPQKTMTDLVHPMLMLPYASTEVVFAPDPAFAPFTEYATNGMYGFSRTGEVQQQYIAGGIDSQPKGVCGYRLGAEPIRIPMTKPVPQWSYVAQVGYAASADTNVRMTFGATTHDVPVQQGLRNVFFQVDGPVTEVTVSAVDPAVTMCIDKITIGPRVGPGDSEPMYPPPVWPQP